MQSVKLSVNVVYFLPGKCSHFTGKGKMYTLLGLLMLYAEFMKYYTLIKFEIMPHLKSKEPNKLIKWNTITLFHLRM